MSVSISVARRSAFRASRSTTCHHCRRRIPAGSHHLLTLGEQALFRPMAVFTGGFSLAAAEAMFASVPGERDSTEAIGLLRETGDRRPQAIAPHGPSARAREEGNIAGPRQTAIGADPLGDELPALAHALTPRETEVLALLVDGCSTIDIVAALYITPRTAGTHIVNLLGKVDVNSRTAAVALALHHGLVGHHSS